MLIDRLLFCDQRGRPLRGDVVTQQFQRLIQTIGLPTIPFYDLRRTATVLLLVGTGGDDVAVGATLGHSRKSNMVRDVYAYLPPEVSAKVADAVSDLLDGGEG